MACLCRCLVRLLDSATLSTTEPCQQQSSSREGSRRDYAALAAAHSKVWCRNMTRNNLTGDLPSNWGSSPSFTHLTVLDLSFNPGLAGGLPGQWGFWGAFPHLQTLSLAMTGLSGQLPQAWGYQTSFPALQTLDLAGNLLQGTLPKRCRSLPSALLAPTAHCAEACLPVLVHGDPSWGRRAITALTGAVPPGQPAVAQVAELPMHAQEACLQTGPLRAPSATSSTSFWEPTLCQERLWSRGAARAAPSPTCGCWICTTTSLAARSPAPGGSGWR